MLIINFIIILFMIFTISICIANIIKNSILLIKNPIKYTNIITVYIFFLIISVLGTIIRIYEHIN
jgi:hypothetical protein